MKSFCILLILSIGIVFQFCTSTKKIQSQTQPVISYQKDIQPVIATSCTPCHIPSKGNKKPLDTYVAAKENIDDMIARIQKNPEERGFMPFKHPKLPDSTIQKFVQWKSEGLVEK